MFRLIKIIFNAFILVMVIVGFNAIGGQKYVEQISSSVTGFLQQRAEENAKKMGNFSSLHEEFQIDNTVNLLGYKAVIAEHKVSGQKMCIIDSGKKPILTEDDFENDRVDEKINAFIRKFKYQSLQVDDFTITKKGTMNAYGEKVPYVKFTAKINKLPLGTVGGVISAIDVTPDESRTLISLNENKKYSQLITNEFFSKVKLNNK